MRYISTRGQAPALNFEDVLLAGPVSYTHLDVYKRQGLQRWKVADQPGRVFVLELMVLQ